MQTGCGGNPAGPCSTEWLNQFLNAYQSLTGQSATTRIAGYGFHIYANWDFSAVGQLCSLPNLDPASPDNDNCYRDRVAAVTAYIINWVNTNDFGKAVWITELNAALPGELTNAVQARRMPLFCNVMNSQGIKRYGWFYGDPTDDPRLLSSSLFSSTGGSLSDSGRAYITCQP